MGLCMLDFNGAVTTCWTSPPVSKTWFIVGRDGGKAAQPIQLSLKINAVNGVSGGQEELHTFFP